MKMIFRIFFFKRVAVIQFFIVLLNEKKVKILAINAGNHTLLVPYILSVFVYAPSAFCIVSTINVVNNIYCVFWEATKICLTPFKTHFLNFPDKRICRGKVWQSRGPAYRTVCC